MFLNVIHKLLRGLMPKGRAFRLPLFGIGDRLLRVISLSLVQVKTDSVAILDSLLPDNDNFTTDDAEKWERMLGIISSNAVPLVDRKAAILRKMVHPKTSRPRQSAAYMQAQLQAAGFDVYVHENRFPGSPPGTYITMSPNDLLGTSVSEVALHSTIIQHGQVQHGGAGFPKVANYLEAEKDSGFVVGTNLRSTFYIAGEILPAYADVLSVREKEFRQLILQLKPANTVAYLFINYV